MTHEEIQRGVVDALTDVAPELDAATLRADVALRDQVDLDSMDILRFAIELHERFGIDVPEADYARLASVDEATRYIGERLEPP